MKLKLKFNAMQILMAELKPNEMWAFYIMAMGDEMPEQVTKAHLTQIIALLLRKLGWLEKSIITSNEDSETTNAAIKEDHKRNNVTTSDTSKICFGQSVLGNKNQVN